MSRSRSLPLLDSLTVASPCPASWDEMEGDGRVRHCSLCQQHVYDLSGMTRSEAEDLLLRTEDRLCIRFYRRKDGTVMTRDCPEGQLTRLRRLAGVVIAAAMVLFLAATAWVVGRSEIGKGFRDGFDGNRAVGPIRALLDWINPPPEPMVLGKMCPPDGRGPGDEGQIVPPEQ